MVKEGLLEPFLGAGKPRTMPEGFRGFQGKVWGRTRDRANCRASQSSLLIFLHWNNLERLEGRTGLHACYTDRKLPGQEVYA